MHRVVSSVQLHCFDGLGVRDMQRESGVHVVHERVGRPVLRKPLRQRRLHPGRLGRHAVLPLGSALANLRVHQARSWARTMGGLLGLQQFLPPRRPRDPRGAQQPLHASAPRAQPTQPLPAGSTGLVAHRVVPCGTAAYLDSWVQSSPGLGAGFDGTSSALSNL